MKYFISIALALTLVGCGHNPPKTPDPLIPIAVPCKTETPNAPTYRYNPPYDDIFDAVRDLLGDREVSQAYEKQLETALKSCK
jgi:hypothetical protein